SGSISTAGVGNLLVSASPPIQPLSNAIVDNGSLTISGTNTVVTFAGNISGSGTISLQRGAQATFNGTIGSEAFTIAGTSKAVINSTVSGTGSFTLLDSGSLEFGAGDSENVTFASTSTGRLTLDHSLTAPFTGKLSGLNPNTPVLLADLAYTTN